MGDFGGDVSPDGGIASESDSKDSFGISELQKRPYLLLQTLLPSVDGWDLQWESKKIKRIIFLRRLTGLLLGINLAHLLVLCICLIYNASLNYWIYLHSLPGGVDGHLEERFSFLTDCVAIYPKHSGHRDFYTIDFLPYATLPRKRALFARSVHTITFQECYNAFWLGVHSDKRQFVGGQLRFLGDGANTSCLQVGQTVRNELTTAAQCLTVSFNFRQSGSSGFSGIPLDAPQTQPLPIVAYIGGQGLLNHRPQLITTQEASGIGALYVVIRYRVGIFGFGDFGTRDYGANHAVEDVRMALNWLHDNAAAFGGNAANITLLGEGSGATIALSIANDRYLSKTEANNTQPYLISKLWLRDGSLVVPRVDSNDRPFHQLILGNVGLLTACRQWQKNNPGATSDSGSSGLSSKISCLENTVNETTWVRITPPEWLHANDRMNTLPGKDDEQSLKSSLITADPEISRVISPFDVANVRDLPIVWISTIHHPLPQTQEMSLKELDRRIKLAFSEFTSPSAQSNYAEEILRAYEPMLDAAKKSPSKYRFTAILRAMINDLRSICGISFYLERLQSRALVTGGPIYRLINVATDHAVLDSGGQRLVDIPAFLAGEQIEATKYPAKLLKKAFTDFINTGKIATLKELRYPRRSNDSAFDTTINFLSRQSLVTAGKREISHLAACRVWRSHSGDADFARKYGILN